MRYTLQFTRGFSIETLTFGFAKRRSRKFSVLNKSEEHEKSSFTKQNFYWIHSETIFLKKKKEKFSLKTFPFPSQHRTYFQPHRSQLSHWISSFFLSPALHFHIRSPCFAIVYSLRIQQNVTSRQIFNDISLELDSFSFSKSVRLFIFPSIFRASKICSTKEPQVSRRYNKNLLVWRGKTWNRRGCFDCFFCVDGIFCRHANNAACIL